jgi:hypothetical protein
VVDKVALGRFSPSTSVPLPIFIPAIAAQSSGAGSIVARSGYSTIAIKTCQKWYLQYIIITFVVSNCLFSELFKFISCIFNKTVISEYLY